MTTQNQAPQNVKIIGFVKAVNPWRRGEPTQFTIATMNSGDFICAAPVTMFCNVQPGDTIEAFVQIVGDRRLSLTKQPFVMMPVDENNVKGCFIKALTGSGFGAVSATELYKALQAIAKRLGFNKPKPLAAVPPTILPNGMIMTAVNPRPKREDRLPPLPVVEVAIKKPVVIQEPGGTQLIIDDESKDLPETPDIPRLTLVPVQEEQPIVRAMPIIAPLPVVEQITAAQQQVTPPIVTDIPTQILTPGGFMIPIPGAATPVTTGVKTTPQNAAPPIGLNIKGIPKRTIAQEAGILDEPEYKPTELSTGEDGVIAVLSELAGAYATTGSTVPITTIMGATKLREQQVKDLLRWWHNQRSLRRLYLLGLTKKEIRGARMNLDYLYEQCMTNPYKVCAIPIDKCNSLMLAMGVIPKTDDVRAGEIIRKVHMNQEGCGHTCTPYHLLRKHFMDLPDYKMYLEKNFDVRYEFDAVYTRYAYKVESSMATYFNALITKTAEKLKAMPTIDTPDMETALFECKTLNEEQKLAIQGALSHHISIIRGGAGVGKCMHPDTPVLLYSGDIITAKDVKTSHQLMGPDSRPRDVVSIVTGKDKMFRIVPAKGKPFICNSVHVLTLRGKTPVIELVENSKTYAIYHTMQGVDKRDYFTNYNSAMVFMSQLPKDIWDLSLDKYLLLGAEIKANCHVYHQSIDFQGEKPSLDAYWIGSLFGDVKRQKLEVLNHMYKFPKDYVDTESEVLPFLAVVTDMMNHRIPREFKINDRNTRLLFLKGYIDSSDAIHEDGLRIIVTSKSMADDLSYLCYSLGLMVEEEDHSLDADDFLLELHITGSALKALPVMKGDKLYKLKTSAYNPRAACHTFNVEEIGDGDYCGWTLNGDGRYLLGDFLVTHNTMCIREIVRNLELRDLSYAACSFTGKAVSRIADVLKKRCAMTMDRMIAQANGKEPFLVCIVDEFSMVTLELMFRFVRAHPWDIRFIFVGDPGQLQPIGWGAVMLALIDCQRVPVYTLTTNHRIIKHELEAEAPQIGVEKAPGDIEFDRVILENANALIDPDRKLSDPVEFREGLGFYIYFGGMAYVTTIAKSLFDSGIDHSRVKILCPYTEPLKQLNTIAQQIFLNDSKKVMDNKQRLWCVGDLVMMTHNNYTINVMNGEEGKVVDVDTSGIKVIFADGAEHKFNYKSNDPFQDKFTGDGEANTDNVTDYDGDELLTKHLVHSFAISVHKSQGSEYEFVIFYLPPHPSGKFTSFINRNLVYTAWTRTKRSVWTVTEKAVLDHAAATDPSHRYEYLCRRLYQSRNEDLEKEMEAITKPKVIVKEVATGGGTTDDGFFDHEDESMYEQHYQD